MNSSNDTIFLSADDITKSFGRFQVLKGVSFVLPRGQILGVTGPNGSGKTTLLNVLSGLVPPDGGEVYFKGLRMTGRPMEEFVRAGIVRTFQVPQTFRSFTVRDSVKVAAAVRGRKGKELDDFVDQVLDATGLLNQQHIRAGKLSQGCLRRLEMARALCLEPEVILLDEIFSALSLMDQREMEELMASLNRERGMTFLMISHNIMVIEELCERALVVDDGRIVYDGPPDRLKEAIG